ncbi:MAG: bifunctional diaminohydroxyphosphoribosylaminopyrimidine deaminase/5-amino-6-(5-phosphoribosylamino)uracil reductase RibD [bacterium]
MDDSDFMRRAIRLARKGAGCVSPNPLVGSVIVRDGKILSEGYHARCGGPHAEADAFSKIHPNEARDGTLYVTLEPCNHHGRTPPCTEAIIQSKIREVVVGARDPNPFVKGGGIQRLKKSGIIVRTGVMEDACLRLNEAYFKMVTKSKPFIVLKIAQTLDGKIATQGGRSRWITSETSRRFVHKMRKENDAVLVGVNTVVQDDPQLTVRCVRGSVRRIILDSRLRIPTEARVLHHSDPQNTIIATTSSAPESKMHALQSLGVSVWILENDENGRVALPGLWKKMIQERILSVLVEGGRTVFTSVLCSGDADRVVVFIAPIVFGSGIESIGALQIDLPENALSFREFSWHKRGPDMVFEGNL